MRLRSNILYRFTCDGCNSIYIGKSKRHFLVRAFEHLGKSIKTGKAFTYNSSCSNNTAVLNHLNQSHGCSATLESFDIIGSARNDFFLKIKESLLIKKVKPTLLNPNGQSVPLHLFDWQGVDWGVVLGVRLRVVDITWILFFEGFSIFSLYNALIVLF